MTYATQTWTDWSGAPEDAPAESKFTAERGNHMEAGIAAAHDELAGTTTGEPGKLLRLDDSGRGKVAEASDDTEVPTLGQVKSEVAKGNGSATRPDHKYLSAQPSTSTTSFTLELTDLAKSLTDMAVGTKLRVNYLLKYRGATGSSTGGLAVKFKTNDTGVTNRLANPSFETDLTGWTSTGSTTPTRATASGGQDGAAYAKLSITGTGNQQFRSEWIDTAPGDVWSAGVYARRASATARTLRADIEYKDAADNLITGGGTLGAGITPGTGGWTQSINDSTHGAGPSTAPSNAVAVRLRISIVSPASGDEFHIDTAQLEPGDVLPAFGHTAGGDAALDIDGAWHGLKLAGASKDDYTRIEDVRTADDPDTTATFGAIGTTSDTVLSGTFDITVLTAAPDLSIVLQVAQQGASGTATQLMSGNATFAVLDAAA